MGGKRVQHYVGEVIDKVEVLEVDVKPYISLFRCICGNEFEKANSKVVEGKTASCGKCPRIWIGGEKYGKWTVLTPTGSSTKGGGSDWKVVCECGTESVRSSRDLRKGATNHCGCSPVYKAPKDITGMTNNKLTAISSTGEKCPNGDYLWNFKCVCGNDFVTSVGRFNSGKTTSCGCAVKEGAKKRENYHGMNKTTTYNSWRKMRERCNNVDDRMYSEYGGKGVKVCPEWNESFKKFYEDMGDCPEGFTIDRIENTKGYSKDNCRWASSYAQSRNRSSSVGTSRFKGVQYEESSNKWIATITVGKYLCKKIGRYQNEEDAAQAYNLASEMIFGKGNTKLVLNDIDEDYSVVNMNCKFFNHWVWKMKELAESLYED